MLAWCSSQVMTISSPAPMYWRPQLWATRLMPSVVPRTKTISSTEPALQEAPHHFARALVGIGGPRRQFVRGAVDVGVLVLVEVHEPVDDGAAASAWWRRCRARSSGRPFTRSARIGKSLRRALASKFGAGCRIRARRRPRARRGLPPPGSRTMAPVGARPAAPAAGSARHRQAERRSEQDAQFRLAGKRCPSAGTSGRGVDGGATPKPPKAMGGGAAGSGAWARRRCTLCSRRAGRAVAASPGIDVAERPARPAKASMAGPRRNRRPAGGGADRRRDRRGRRRAGEQGPAASPLARQPRCRGAGTSGQRRRRRRAGRNRRPAAAPDGDGLSDRRAEHLVASRVSQAMSGKSGRRPISADRAGQA